MKKILPPAIPVLLLLAIFSQRNLLISEFNKYYYIDPCGEPVKYKIGEIDSRFNVSEDQFLKNIQQGEKIWENQSDKNLFEYKLDGDLTVNLIYDERQSLKTKVDNLSGDLNLQKQTLDSQIADYKNRVNQFYQKADALNAEIRDWNSKGGAPPEEFQRLKNEQENLKQESSELNDLAKKLNQTTVEYNGDINNLNSAVGDLKEALSEKPEEGIYDPNKNRIDIYFSFSQKEMIHTLAHELGHALGINHNDNPNSIMYSFSNQNLDLSKDDIEELNKVCKILTVPEVLKIKLQIIINYYQTLLNKGLN